MTVGKSKLRAGGSDHIRRSYCHRELSNQRMCLRNGENCAVHNLGSRSMHNPGNAILACSLEDIQCTGDIYVDVALWRVVGIGMAGQLGENDLAPFAMRSMNPASRTSPRRISTSAMLIHIIEPSISAERSYWTSAPAPWRTVREVRSNKSVCTCNKDFNAVVVHFVFCKMRRHQ